ncbi:unnamed protein product [Mucor circinelloides]|uniref:C2H2-type domain-containing protein n=1 Tax=Mucor circinelloides f. circinelloides (strain 1006PhL) TaxID=1220926 RepID=S2JR95_MUCC1|nr:hypothetical protein HMPREF1544_08105 [Mucor circinelloides 1006PhL]KAG1092953.1 hypothetical protein G6F42_019069 [Rhizopus arrhizus]
MNTRFTFAELLTSPIPQHHSNYDQEKLDYYYYNPYQQHPHPTQWNAMPNFYTQSVVSPPTPQPQSIPSMPLSPPPSLLPSPSQQQPQQQRTRGRRVSNIPNYGTRMFACKTEGCGKVFKRSEHLKRHVRSIHTMEKPFKCPYQSCNKRFSRSDNLNQHIRIHRHSKSSFASSASPPSISNSSSTTTNSSSSLPSPSQYNNSLYRT